MRAAGPAGAGFRPAERGLQRSRRGHPRGPRRTVGQVRLGRLRTGLRRDRRAARGAGVRHGRLPRTDPGQGAADPGRMRQLLSGARAGDRVHLPDDRPLEPRPSATRRSRRSTPRWPSPGRSPGDAGRAVGEGSGGPAAGRLHAADTGFGDFGGADEGDRARRRHREPALPGDPGRVQAAAAALRQADDLLPGLHPADGGHPRNPDHHHAR